MADGKGCKCAAYDESECACDVDWTPQELIDARAEIARLRLTDAERVAIYWALATVETDTTPDAGQNAEAAATLRGLLERTE